MRLLRAMAKTTNSADTPSCSPLASMKGALSWPQFTSTTLMTELNSSTWPVMYQPAGL